MGWSLSLSVTAVALGHLVQGQWIPDATATVPVLGNDLGVPHVIALLAILAAWFLNRRGVKLGANVNKIVGTFVLIGRLPLSKAVLTGDYDRRALIPREEHGYTALNVTLRPGKTAAALNPGARQVTFTHGTSIGYDTLVIATGARARTLPLPALDGVRTIRTIQDSTTIAGKLAAKPRVAVIGAGFIGAEVASTANTLGCEVTILEAGTVPLRRALGPVMGHHCTTLHEANGITVLTGQTITGFTGDTHVRGVQTTDGVVPADLVAVGIGSIPNTEWLTGSGLAIDNGVLCDPTGHADQTGQIFAVGDVASWFDTETATHHRHEHWTSAIDQAKTVGRQLAGHPVERHDTQPYFWSDQHGVKIQMIGHAHPDDDIQILHGDTQTHKFLAAYHRDGAVTAVLAFNSPRLIARYRPLIIRRPSLQATHEFADTLEPGWATTQAPVPA
jgi:3-phenylpropionate/trans-cinnamate dioxygenase ferredoxin reductase subunit